MRLNRSQAEILTTDCVVFVARAKRFPMVQNLKSIRAAFLAGDEQTALAKICQWNGLSLLESEDTVSSEKASKFSDKGSTAHDTSVPLLHEILELYLQTTDGILV